MGAYRRAVLSFTVLVVLIVILYIFTGWFSRTTGYVLGEDEKVGLAQCLDGRGSVFYISANCPRCQDQLDLFGNDASQFLNIYLCESSDTCPAEGGVPSWRINDGFHYGVKELKELIVVSGCEVIG